MMSRAGRIVVVTLGLVGAGAIFGALAGGLAFSAVGIFTGQQISAEDFQFGALVGAPLGAFIAPPLAWLLLRRVPLGQMFLACTFGTIVGAIAGWFLTPPLGEEVSWAMSGAFLGCVFAAIVLSLRVRRARS